MVICCLLTVRNKLIIDNSQLINRIIPLMRVYPAKAGGTMGEVFFEIKEIDTKKPAPIHRGVQLDTCNKRIRGGRISRFSCFDQ